MKDLKLINILQDKSLTTKERGDALEEQIRDILNEYGITVKKTKASGALHGDGDIITEYITFDGKVKGDCINSNISQDELIKISRQAAKNDNIGAIVVPCIKDENKVDLYATLKLVDLIELLLARNK